MHAGAQSHSGRGKTHPNAAESSMGARLHRATILPWAALLRCCRSGTREWLRAAGVVSQRAYKRGHAGGRTASSAARSSSGHPRAAHSAVHVPAPAAPDDAAACHTAELQAHPHAGARMSSAGAPRIKLRERIKSIFKQIRPESIPTKMNSRPPYMHTHTPAQLLIAARPRIRAREQHDPREPRRRRPRRDVPREAHLAARERRAPKQQRIRAAVRELPNWRHRGKRDHRHGARTQSATCTDSAT